MIEVTLNGKPLTPESLEAQLIQGITQQLRERLGSIRHPVTGEFPTIAVTGSSLDSLVMQVEGSAELIELVKARFEAEDEAGHDGDASPQTDVSRSPKVFLSYAFDDSALAERIAKGLMANGIDTFWAEWCIASGDSIRQRIDEGISECTHFVVLLTPQSIQKPWVKQEMDAGLVRKLNGLAKFIALRSGVSTSNLPPTLQGMLSPTVNTEPFDIQQLVNDIHGVTKKPLLGASPAIVAEVKAPETGYSVAATAIAKFFVTGSTSARKFEPMTNIAELSERLCLSDEDVEDAVFELKGLVTKHHEDLVYPEDELFVRFDRFWMDWDPAVDAHQLAVAMVNEASFPSDPKEIAEHFGWQPRRLNPALAYLANRGLARTLKAMNTGPWLLATLQKTDETRRFAKSR